MSRAFSQTAPAIKHQQHFTQAIFPIQVRTQEEISAARVSGRYPHISLADIGD
jgi:hypothetical protein